MRKNTIVICVVCGLISLFPFVTFAHIIKDRRVSVQVEEKVKTQKTSDYGAAQDIVLEIKLRGKVTNSVHVVKWAAYGRDQKTDAVSVLKTGEQNVDFSSEVTQKITSDNISATFTKKHSVRQSSGKRGSGRGKGRGSVKYVRVEGSGVKYIGYGVQIFDGDEVVGEKYEPALLETEAEVSGKAVDGSTGKTKRDR